MLSDPVVFKPPFGRSRVAEQWKATQVEYGEIERIR